MTILAGLATLLPGLAWWAWLGRQDEDPLVSLAQVIGLSLAWISLLAEGVFLLRGSFSPASLLIILAGCLAAAVWGFWRHGMKVKKRYRWHLAIGLALFGLTIAWRLFQAKDLVLPNWVDSQHHFLIIRVILENGGLPETLSPYLPVPFYYHFGFHAATALFTAMSRLPIANAMLIFGQLLNAAISLSAYALAKSLWRDWRPAAAAALLVSFVTRMPAYYLSWGRYTLTTGLVLLPLAMGFGVSLLHRKHQKRDIFTLGLLTGGVLLSHYFAGLLLAVFYIALALVYLAARWDKPLTALLQFSYVPLGAALGLLLAVPWLVRLVKYSVMDPTVTVNLPETVGLLFENDRWEYIWQLLSPASNHWLLLAAGLGLLFGLVCKKSMAFGIWSLALGLFSLPLGQQVGPFRPDHFTIILFLPATLWAGWGFWQAARWLSRRLSSGWIKTTLPALLVLIWIAWSFQSGADIVNPVTTLVTPADLRALDWVEKNTPEDARFFINTTGWLGETYRGVDGGGWLLPYTGRWTLVPTAFYTFSPDKDSKLQLSDWGKRASTIQTCSSDFWNLVEQANLSWIYLSAGEGSLQPGNLKGCEGLKIAYVNERIWIFQVNAD